MSGRRLILLVLLASTFGACDDGATPRPPGIGRPAAGLYEVNATVLESEEHGPELCLGLIAASYPPQCGGVPVRNWDWSGVAGEKTGDGSAWGAGETTWGDYHLIGTYDGDVFTVVTSGPPERSGEAERYHLGTPCDEPAGGWAAVDPRRSSDRDSDRAARRAESRPDFVDVWVDYYDGHEIILNVAFTGSLYRHERELREVWGGALCLTKRDRTYAELEAIREEVSAHPDLDVLWSSTMGNEGVVEIAVVAVDDATRAEIDERYGKGTVQIDARLRPVD